MRVKEFGAVSDGAFELRPLRFLVKFMDPSEISGCLSKIMD
jgi:hypothetical protein